MKKWADMTYKEQQSIVNDFIDFLPYNYLKNHFKHMRMAEIIRHPWFRMYWEVFCK